MASVLATGLATEALSVEQVEQFRELGYTSAPDFFYPA